MVSQMTAEAALVANIRRRSTEQLKELAVLAMADFRDDANVVLDCVCRELELRLPEAEFVTFSDSL